VWDALAEAIDWATTTTADDGSPSEDFGRVLMARPADDEALQRAVRVWVLVMADRYNSGHHWPHPSVRRHFPPLRFRHAAAGGAL
jgi:ferric-dicitrate binding protein FerR (iron transport regulator)